MQQVAVVKLIAISLVLVNVDCSAHCALCERALSCALHTVQRVCRSRVCRVACKVQQGVASVKLIAMNSTLCTVSRVACKVQWLAKCIGELQV